MARFFLHIIDGKTITDVEGQEFLDLDDARAEAVASARSLMREAIWRGQLPLNESIQIADGDGQVLDTVAFRDVITIDES